MTPLLLGVLAGLLAGPLPALLARWRRARHTPRAAMLLWQSMALAAVLAALGAGISLATDHAWRPSGPLDTGAYVVAGLALLVTGLVAGRLLLSAHQVGTRVRALRREHRAQVDLVARRDAARSANRAGRSPVMVLDHDLPVAYCVPGMQGSRVVISAGAVGRLSTDELDAVLAHERAHLRARHDLVLEAFSVLHRAFPRWVSSAAALREVRLLVEVLADRAALRTGEPMPQAVDAPDRRRSLGRALAQLAGSGEVKVGITHDTASLETTRESHNQASSLVVRVRLLADRDRHRVQATMLVAFAAALLALPTAFVVVPWLAGL